MKSPEAIRAIIQELKRLYPDGICSLRYQKDYELLFATRLSAQCTDERVNQVTPALFARYPSLEALAAAKRPDFCDLLTQIDAIPRFRCSAALIVCRETPINPASSSWRIPLLFRMGLWPAIS